MAQTPAVGVRVGDGRGSGHAQTLRVIRGCLNRIWRLQRPVLHPNMWPSGADAKPTVCRAASLPRGPA